MKPTRTALAALLALTALAAHADATLDRIKQRGKIVVGVMLSGPPFGTIDPVTQRHVGYNVQLSEGVAKGLGVGVETVQVQPSNRVQFLQQGKVDILIANMQWTQERSEILSFVPTPLRCSTSISQPVRCQSCTMRSMAACVSDSPLRSQITEGEGMMSAGETIS